MTQYLGDFAADSTVYVPWATNDKDGGSITRATDGSIRIYKNDGTAEKTTANGITDNEDFDTLTGVHLVVIDTSNDTGDAGFWVAGNDYFVVLVAATIDGETVNHPIAHFSIENRFMRGTDSANTTTPLTAAQVNAEVDTALADYDPPTKAEMDAGLAALNDVSAADVNAQVDLALSDYDPPTKAEMDTAINALNDLSAADVNAQVDLALSDYDPPTKAEMDTAINALNDLSAADVNAQVDLALSDYDPPTKAEMDAGFAGTIDANIVQVLGTTDPASGLADMGSDYEDHARVGSDLQAIHGTSITEVTSGRIANNFDTFFENGDAATTKTVDDVGSGGGGGLTQQQVRDAMKLAPTAGTPAAGSVDNHLDDLVAFTPAAGAIEVTDIVVNSGGSPLEGAELWITTDSAGSNVVWSGVTESNGNPKDSAGNNPWLDAGAYHIWVQHSSTEFPSLPISKTVS